MTVNSSPQRGNSCEIQYSDALDAAVIEADQAAVSGDTVLRRLLVLADMFDGFEHRGKCYEDAVRALDGARGGFNGQTIPMKKWRKEMIVGTSMPNY